MGSKIGAGKWISSKGVFRLISSVTGNVYEAKPFGKWKLKR